MSISTDYASDGSTRSTAKELSRRVAGHLRFIYPDQGIEGLAEQLFAEMTLSRNLQSIDPHQNNGDETDSILFTDGNSVLKDGELPLYTLHRLLNRHLTQTITGVHILPFFPFSSNHGFSVMDFLQVNPSVAIGKTSRLSARSGSSYLNFIASHDGTGLRRLDGLLAENERSQLVETTQKFRGKVSYRKARKENDKPYELNVALYDALIGTIQGGENE